MHALTGTTFAAAVAFLLVGHCLQLRDASLQQLGQGTDLAFRVRSDAIGCTRVVGTTLFCSCVLAGLRLCRLRGTWIRDTVRFVLWLSYLVVLPFLTTGILSLAICNSAFQGNTPSFMGKSVDEETYALTQRVTFIVTIVLALLVGRRVSRLEREAKQRSPGCCKECGYDLAGLARDVCPECGERIPRAQWRALTATSVCGAPSAPDAAEKESGV